MRFVLSDGEARRLAREASEAEGAEVKLRATAIWLEDQGRHAEAARNWESAAWEARSAAQFWRLAADENHRSLRLWALCTAAWLAYSAAWHAADLLGGW